MTTLLIFNLVVHKNDIPYILSPLLLVFQYFLSSVSPSSSVAIMDKKCYYTDKTSFDG